ncbi:MAG: hypothetical protein J6T74_02350 [Clostridia bacterium]|nr:hypothetical protein [Clostridia bacterium]
MTKCQHVIELKSYMHDKQLIEEKTVEIENSKALILNAISRLYEIRKLDSSSNIVSSKIQDLLNRRVVDEDAIFKMLDNKNKIEKKIDCLLQPYKNILFLKYIRGDSVEEICSKMNLSLKRFYELHKDGVEMYKKINT